MKTILVIFCLLVLSWIVPYYKKILNHPYYVVDKDLIDHDLKNFWIDEDEQVETPSSEDDDKLEDIELNKKFSDYSSAIEIEYPTYTQKEIDDLDAMSGIGNFYQMKTDENPIVIEGIRLYPKNPISLVRFGQAIERARRDGFYKGFEMTFDGYHEMLEDYFLMLGWDRIEAYDAVLDGLIPWDEELLAAVLRNISRIENARKTNIST